MMANLSAEEAHQQLNSISSPEELKTLIDNLSVEIEGKTPRAQTVLYSGAIIKDNTRINTSDIASELSNNPNLRLINNTEADRFLASIYIKDESHPDFKMGEDLREVLEKQFGGNPLQRGTPSNTYYNQANGGAWDKVSENFVQNSKGEVITLIGDNASPDRIFFQTELEAVRANPNITHIDGIVKTTFFNELDKLKTPQQQINHLKKITREKVEIAQEMNIKNPLEVNNMQRSFKDKILQQSNNIKNLDQLL